jgi:hypothetical protein
MQALDQVMRRLEREKRTLMEEDKLRVVKQLGEMDGNKRQREELQGKLHVLMERDEVTRKLEESARST